MQQQAITQRRLEEMIRQVQSGKLQMSEQDAIAMAGQLYASGRLVQAIEVCRQIVARKPEVADAHSIMGVALNAQGKTKEAIASLKRAVKAAPKIASYRSNLGEIQRQSGNLADAIVSLLEAIELDPKNAQAHNNLGIARFDSRNYAEAADAYRKAIELKPDFAEAQNNLGNALRRMGKIQDSIEAYQNALAVRERYPEAYNNLGTMLRELGKEEQAEHALRKAIQQNPKYVEARTNLASLYHHQKKDVDALRELGDVLKFAPKDVRALVLTARCQARRFNFVSAEQACRLALKEEPENAEVLTVLGMVLHELDRYDEAVEVLEKADALAPRNAETLSYFGVALKSVGRLDDARDKIIKGVELNPNMIAAYANLNDLVDYSKEKELYDRLEKVMSVKGKRHPELMLPLHYAYAKALDDNGQPEKALEHYIEGGKIKRTMLNYDEADTFKFYDDIKRTFTREFIAGSPFEGNPTDRLLFIVGMPRSGSTLVEQILASNDAVYGAGEVKYFSQGLHKLRDRFPSLSRFPDMMAELKPNHYKLLADSYTQAMFKAAGDARIVTDKLLTNYFFVGLIHMLFPNAKIINTRRDPVDSSLSAFTKLFKDDMPHSYDMGELGRYYRQYDALMKHWEKVLPKGVMKVVEYEKVVADTEKEARGVIEFLGLDWDDKMLEFYKSSRPVKTASVAQVRKPIYKTAVKRWKKYGAGLQPLIDAIEKA
ncbi:MAG: tetratricopeptide repeat protein [Novosphingobium sp.]|nr:tetratricopeptide repeat protein [Novosphingobium sp.]MBO9603353.1 tetratricopeptide repeat protein [Novosphingobium sp.]